jgi:HD-GYP domain-containing protein (c-di-GMP phosphodiesterase class II)
MGFSQNQIPLLSRIFSVIDSYTAMTSKRPYRNPLTKGLAIDNLIKDKEIKYDPQVIDIFVNYLLNMRTGGLL